MIIVVCKSWFTDCSTCSNIAFTQYIYFVNVPIVTTALLWRYQYWSTCPKYCHIWFIRPVLAFMKCVWGGYKIWRWNALITMTSCQQCHLHVENWQWICTVEICEISKRVYFGCHLSTWLTDLSDNPACKYMKRVALPASLKSATSQTNKVILFRLWPNRWNVRSPN